MAEDALINSHFKDCIFALLADYPNNHNKRAHYFPSQLVWLPLGFEFLYRSVFEQLLLKSLCQAAAICLIHYCAVFYRSLLSEHFCYVCSRYYSKCALWMAKFICIEYCQILYRIYRAKIKDKLHIWQICANWHKKKRITHNNNVLSSFTLSVIAVTS